MIRFGIRRSLTLLEFVKSVVLFSLCATGILPASAGDAISAAGCNAAWHRVPSPSPAHQQFDANQLSGVYALSSTDAWAVGWSVSFGGGGYRTLAEHWDGTRWKMVPTPNSPQPNNYLQAVAAVGPDVVWAVGQQDDGAGDSWTLVEHWDGKVWAIDDTATMPGSLGAVAALSSSDVWSSGFNLEHWDGSWTFRRIGGDSYLRSLAGTANDLWAVGTRTVQPIGPVLTLTEHWDGSVWTRFHGVDPITDSTDDENVLNGVAVAPGDSHPWAVGYFANFDGSPRAHTLVEQWDGTQWKRVRAPNPGGAALDNQLWDVAAISSTNAWAVGVVNDGGSNNQTLIERWDGAAWSTIASPHAGALLRIAANAATGDLWAVGYTEATDYQATLILQACSQ